MLNVDLPKYLALQNNKGQWGTQLDMLFISIMYGVQIRPYQWFGDAFIAFNAATELGLRDLHQFVVSAAPVIWFYFFVHTAPGFTGIGVNHFCTILEFLTRGAENR